MELSTYKDRQILYLDFTNLYPTQANKYLEESKSVISKQPKKEILLLVNAADLHVSDNLVGLVINYVTKVINEYLNFCSSSVIASAIIRPKKLDKCFLSSISALKNTRAAIFDDIEGAKEWLKESK
jgi:hypothetical protein